jgi:hypothetical protein
MPTASVQAPAAKVNQARQRAIAPHLEKLEQLYAQWVGDGRSGGCMEIRLHESLLPLDSWETEQVRLFLENELVRDGGPPFIVSQGVALLIKCAADMFSMMSAVDPSEDQFYALQAELMLDTAIGMAMLRETQQAQNNLVQEGDVEQARKLSKFHHKLRNSLAIAKKMIGETERERADQITDQLTDEPRQESASPDKLAMDSAAARAAEQYEQSKIRERVQRKAREALSKLPSRTDLLIYGFLLVMAVWLGAVVLPQAIRSEPPTISLADLNGSGIFTRVEAKPPSLFIEVDMAMWDELDAEARLTLVEMTGHVLAENGYSGALLRTARGRPLAQWLEKRGAVLIETEETSSSSWQAGGPDAPFIP